MSSVYAADLSAAFLPKLTSIFTLPAAAGRRIVCGFSYLQRIGKGATTDIWFPAFLREEVAARVLAGDENVLDAFQAEWAAVRQIELLQEAGNLSIEDLEFTDFKRAFNNLMKMRAGGYRITVVTLGRYENGEIDDLRILDLRLQEEIARIIHMLYLEEQSAHFSKECARALNAGKWKCAEKLPHVTMTLGTADLLKRQNRDLWLKKNFFRILDLLPQNHIVHDVAVGLQLPDASKERNWIYLAQGEHQFTTYMRMFSDVFRSFDMISLGRLQERADASNEVIPVMRHMRGYGDRLRVDQENQNRTTANFLNNVCF